MTTATYRRRLDDHLRKRFPGFDAEDRAGLVRVAMSPDRGILMILLKACLKGDRVTALVAASWFGPEYAVTITRALDQNAPCLEAPPRRRGAAATR